MAGFTMPYMIPLFLGMTFDAQNSQPGVSIFEDKWVDNPMVSDIRSYESNYRVVTEMSELLKTLDISGDLSLKIKSGTIQLQGTGSYLKEHKSFDKSIIILTTMTYTSVVKTLDSYAIPRQNWVKDFTLGVLGTHYVTDVTYGAKMIASAKVVAHNAADLESIKGDVIAAIDKKGNGLDLAGKLDKLEESITNKSTIEISYFGTVPIKSIPNSIKGLKELINTFTQQVEDAGLEDGIPVSVLLEPLVNIADPEDKDKFQFIKNEALMIDLNDFEDKFDELNSARSQLIEWIRTLPFDLDKKYKNEIGSLLKTLDDILDIFYKVLAKMDVTKGAEQLKEAFEAYGANEFMKYQRLVIKLKRKIDQYVDKDAYTVSDTYIHWGNDTCTGDNTTLLYKGFMVSSTDEGVGGMADYTCMGENIALPYNVSVNKQFHSLIAGIRYAEMDTDSNPFKGPHARQISGKGVPCAKCYSADAGTITVFHADESCPVTWELKYRGFLMSAKTGGHTTEYVCIDEVPTKPYAMDSVSDSKNLLTLTVVSSSGSLPSDKYANGALVKCVVCALRSGSSL